MREVVHRMKCEEEDCPQEATVIVNEQLYLCDGHLYDYLDSPISSTIFRYLDRQRMVVYERLWHMELPKEKVLEVIRKIKSDSPEHYPPTRHFLFESGRKVEGFPGSQDTLKSYLDKLVAEKRLSRASERYRGSSRVPYQTKYSLSEDAKKASPW